MTVKTKASRILNRKCPRQYLMISQFLFSTHQTIDFFMGISITSNTTCKNGKGKTMTQRTKSLGVFLSVMFLVLTHCVSEKKAGIRETTETLLTYAYGDPDPVPILTRSGLWGRGARLYPYTFIDKYSHTGKEKGWKVIYLENPYIEVAVLPEAGGKIWGATEKSTQREFIYTNHVMKFREVALRGPWTSGGIEFNFGIVGHTPSGAHPVDYLLMNDPDGSVSCVVGNMDLPSRTRWSVTITVPKDKAFFETRTFWYNPSPLHQSYYAWMNGAIHTADDLQCIFPGHFHIAHNFAEPLKPWPIDLEGRDLSWYKNNDFGSYKSYFTVGEYEDFFGGYWHDADFGFGHWAHYDDMPGQKVWIWGLSQQGMIWEDLLTDNDGQYSEPQAGRFLNQNDHGFFTPYAADHWREIWFPYKDIGPMVKATPHAVLHAERTEESLTVNLCPLQALDDDLVISVGSQEKYRERLRLKPMETVNRTYPLQKSSSWVSVQISDKLLYTDNPQANDLQRPIRFHDFDETTLEGLFLTAERLNQERNYYRALQKYLAVLDQEPLHTQALKRVAELYFRRGEYGKALQYAEKALDNVLYDVGANYIYGIISRRLGRLVDAKETLGWAARSLYYRSAAYCQMSEIYLYEKKWNKAEEYARRALDYNAYNINALQALAIVFRKKNLGDKAQEMLLRINAADPLNHVARFEGYNLKPNTHNLEQFQSQIRNELPQETYLEIALYYHSLNLNSEALQILSFIQDHPVASYWMAYLWRSEDPQQAQTYLIRALEISPLLVFPYREETIPVLQWALNQFPDEWKTKYYLALVLWSKGRVAETQQLLKECGHPNFAPFYIARASFLLEQNPQMARQDLEKAVEVDNSSWRNWFHLISFLNQQELSGEAMAFADKALEKFPEEIPIRMERVRALMAQKRFAEALEVLESSVVLPSEGATGVHSLFVRCHIQLGLEAIRQNDWKSAIQHLERSQEYPENLGTGKPYDPDFRLQEYLMALCFERLGESQRAESLRKSIHTFTSNWMEKDKGTHAYFGGLVLQYYGEHEKARELLSQEKPSQEVLDILKMLRK
jgi:tetratricopeptide (TPR) repeat protein